MGFASLLLKQIFTLFNCSADKIRSLRRSLEQLVWLINICRIFTSTLEMFLTMYFHFPNSQEKKKSVIVYKVKCAIYFHHRSLSIPDCRNVTGSSPNARQSINPRQTFNPQNQNINNNVCQSRRRSDFMGRQVFLCICVHFLEEVLCDIQSL